MPLARRLLDAPAQDLDSKARALEWVARFAATSAVYAPAPGDDDPGWAAVASQLERGRPSGAPVTPLRRRA